MSKFLSLLHIILCSDLYSLNLYSNTYSYILKAHSQSTKAFILLRHLTFQTQ